MYVLYVKAPVYVCLSNKVSLFVCLIICLEFFFIQFKGRRLFCDLVCKATYEIVQSEFYLIWFMTLISLLWFRSEALWTHIELL